MAKLKNLPSQNQIEADIIQVLKDLDGRARRGRVIDTLVARWQLTPDELNYSTPGGCVYYQHRIDGVAHRLRREQRIIAPQRGVWQLRRGKETPPDEPDKIAEALLPEGPEMEQEQAAKSPRRHEELIQELTEMGGMVGKTVEAAWGPIYRHDCVWKSNPYANPQLVVEVCDKGNLDKDIASLHWAVQNWGAKGILIAFEDDV